MSRDLWTINDSLRVGVEPVWYGVTGAPGYVAHLLREAPERGGVTTLCSYTITDPVKAAPWHQRCAACVRAISTFAERATAQQPEYVREVVQVVVTRPRTAEPAAPRIETKLRAFKTWDYSVTTVSTEAVERGES